MMRFTARFERGQQAIWLLAPWLLGTCLLVLLPLLGTLGLLFTQYDVLSAPTWVGLTNITHVGNNPLFWRAITNSLIFLAVAIPLRFGLTLGLGVVLAKPRPHARWYRTIIYIPSLIPDVAYALLWLWIFNPIYGPLNLLLTALGLPPSPWLLDATSARMSLVLLTVFQIGDGFVMIIAGRQSLSQHYYDAAAVDGASPWQQFRHITLPLLAPWLVLLILRDCVVTLQQTITTTALMTKGEPYYATLFLPSLIYQEAFDRFRFGPAAVMMLALFVGLGLIAVSVVMITRRTLGRG
ncbi:sugar ABC transporter permease [Herpetosiphon gulosus]